MEKNDHWVRSQSFTLNKLLNPAITSLKGQDPAQWQSLNEQPPSNQFAFTSLLLRTKPQLDVLVGHLSGHGDLLRKPNRDSLRELTISYIHTTTNSSSGVIQGFVSLRENCPSLCSNVELNCNCCTEHGDRQRACQQVQVFQSGLEPIRAGSGSRQFSVKSWIFVFITHVSFKKIWVNICKKISGSFIKFQEDYLKNIFFVTSHSYSKYEIIK